MRKKKTGQKINQGKTVSEIKGRTFQRKTDKH